MNIKKLVINILVPIVLGSIVGLLTSSFNNYSGIVNPSFAPPKILFPIVWTILYTLMGISSYLIKQSDDMIKDEALFIYYLQLGVNLLWSFIFFTFKLYLFAFIWIILLIVLVIIMIIMFYRINKISGLIQIPYLLWLLFAAILNISIVVLN